MRRLLALLIAVLGVLAVLPGLALADDAPAAQSSGELTLLAVDDAPVGPEPTPRDAEENPARDLGDYGDRDAPVLGVAAAVLLTALGFIGLALLLGFYRYRVAPPSKDRAST